MHRLSTFKQRNIKLLLLATALLLSALVVYASWINHLAIKQKTNENSVNLEQTIQSELSLIHQSATEQIHSYYSALQDSDGSLDSIRRIIQVAVYERDSTTRYIWADNQNITQISSHVRKMDVKLDISERPYMHQARVEPGILHISQPFEHGLAHFNRQIITYAIGVEHPDYEGYFGTLYALIDLKKIEEFLAPMLADCGCEYRLSHLGDVILASEGAADALPTADPKAPLSITMAPAPAVLQALARDAWAQGALALLAVNALMASIYWLIRTRILRPVSQAITALVPAGTAAHVPITQEPFEQLDALAEHYRAMQARLAEQETVISQLNGIMSQLQTQHTRFLAASGSEMHDMFSAVQSYASHLEEQILKRQLDPDAEYDFDDIKEKGENLRHLSACFEAFSNKNNSKTETADPARLTHKTLMQLEPMIERRAMNATFEQGRNVWVTHPDARFWIESLSRALLYTAIRYGEDESALTLVHEARGESMRLTCSVSRFRQSALPTHEQDFGMFMNALAKDMSETTETWLKSHVNVLLAEAISQRLGGELTVTAAHEGPSFTLVAQFATQGS